MSVLKDIKKIVIASHNNGKLKEISNLLHPLGIQTVSAAELALPEPEETGTTFAANASLKAEAAAMKSGLAALSDDSGLCVVALDDAPGIYSARWAGPEKDFKIAMQEVNRQLEDNVNRRAYFVCALALAIPNNKTQVFQGRIDGNLIWPPRGDKGFGYDPIFVPDGYEITFGEMEPEKKHSISHRALAFQNLLEALK